MSFFMATHTHLRDLAAEAARSPGMRPWILQTIAVVVDMLPPEDRELALLAASNAYSSSYHLVRDTPWVYGLEEYINITTLPDWPGCVVD